MANEYAMEKFFAAVNAFKSADDQARSGGLDKIDAQAFQMVIIDLDAAIPALSGIMLGRALVLKGQCIYWLHLDKLTKSTDELRLAELRLLGEDIPPDPLLKEGLSCAIKGRDMLEKHGATSELPWANDIVHKLSG